MNTKVCTFNKKNISVDENGVFSFTCSPEFAKDMKEMYGVDVQSQKILRNVFFNTPDGKVSFTVPNKILRKH